MPAADIFFDDEQLLVVGITSPKDAIGAHPDRVIELPANATDQEIVDAVRNVWVGIEKSDLFTEQEQRDAWYRVSDVFGISRESKNGSYPYTKIKRIGVNYRDRPKRARIVVYATVLRGVNRTSIDDGESKLPLDASDDELGDAIRKALSATRK